MPELEWIWSFLLDHAWESMAIYWPWVATAFMFALITFRVFRYFRKPPYKRTALEIHYRFTSKTEITFESVTKIVLLKNNVKAYETAIHGTRQRPVITSKDPNMSVVVSGSTSCDLRPITVNFATDLRKGEQIIPLSGSYTDTTMAENPRLPFRINGTLGELFIFVHLPDNETVRAAHACIFKPHRGGFVKISDVNLPVWEQNSFDYVFHGVKPNRIYELNWQYDGQPDPIPKTDSDIRLAHRD